MMQAGYVHGNGGGKFVGTVKLFNQQKGWGMVSCELTQQIYHKDIFFMKSGVPGGNISTGAKVRFAIRIEAKGPVAFDVQPLNCTNVGMQPLNYLTGLPLVSLSSGLIGAALSGRLPSSSHILYGTVMSFNEEKGWGFIHCEATKKLFNKDVFVMKNILKGIAIKIGDLVFFKMEMGMRGPQATEISVLLPGSIGADGQPGRRFKGVIKMFDAEKGWGFIEGQEVKDTFGKDLFIHKRELGEMQDLPQVGAEVSFTVELDNRGQPQAKNVEFSALGEVEEAAGKTPSSEPTAEAARVSIRPEEAVCD